MPKLPVLSGKDVCRILRRHGFEEVRRRGSHIVMQKKVESSTITIPVPIIKNCVLEPFKRLSVSPAYLKIFSHSNKKNHQPYKLFPSNITRLSEARSMLFHFLSNQPYSVPSINLPILPFFGSRIRIQSACSDEEYCRITKSELGVHRTENIPAGTPPGQKMVGSINSFRSLPK